MAVILACDPDAGRDELDAPANLPELDELMTSATEGPEPAVEPGLSGSRPDPQAQTQGALPISPQGAEDIRVGAWWSNKENGQTSLPPWDVALRLRKGGTVHESFTADTNFQRLRVPALAGGDWTLEVETVGSAPFTGRRVHVFVYYRAPDIACTFGIPEVPQP